ncbi:MAG: bifunctional UDP-N-acetylglucosamine diphosphorylase/glucosamine-1-phosphate N-acetyltransferase GlmU [Candidatus Dormibacteraeota bacterium]|uniref:Bifunctional protein GlmU n=1 Tax=Candidatus Amunia macphersoniae TaxID=3127014 RepID=A0A934NIG3_9BACT|nr:bifunctional UDP-N-acetylglucosamine diphosphorylase/glucosamine-1-phosphate N-acetyltransferase GlmU [Candidatus Dormibacteraeota bacterium]
MADGPRAVILAAGDGTRMRSALPKVLHQLAGRALIDHVIDAATAVTSRQPVVIVGAGRTDVVAAIGPRAECVEQSEASGTGDALRSVPERLRGPGEVLVLSGDVPLVRPQTLGRLIDHHRRTRAAATLLTAMPANPRGLGRVYRDPETGRVVRTIEERDLPPGAYAPPEVAAGVYVFNAAKLWPALGRINNSNAQGEYYLPDVLPLLGGHVEAMLLADAEEALGVNDRSQLATAESVIRARILERLMADGVTIEDPTSTYVDAAVRVGRDSVIRPMSFLRGTTVLGEGCQIGPMAQLTDVTAGTRVIVGSSHVEASELGDGVVIGSFNRVRPGSVLAPGVSMGTHAEVKNSHIGAGSRINHLSCVLDSDLGEQVNVGAGAVTCNFDGSGKHRTVIEDGVFVGTNSTLVAPLTIHRDAYVAAGSIVNEDVPEGALAVGRGRQRNVEGWSARRRNRPVKAPG